MMYKQTANPNATNSELDAKVIIKHPSSDNLLSVTEARALRDALIFLSEEEQKSIEDLWKIKLNILFEKLKSYESL